MPSRTLFDWLRIQGKQVGVLGHLERHLGAINRGWGQESFGVDGPNGQTIQVARFKRGPLKNTVPYSTLGLSSHELRGGRPQKAIRHELVLLSKESFGDRNIPGVLHDVAVEALTPHRAYLRGDVLGPRGTLFDGSKMEALYVAIPVYFPESFHECVTPEGWTVIFAWLVPITANEAVYVQSAGWSAFEAKLEEHQPDLTDFFREPMPI